MAETKRQPITWSRGNIFTTREGIPVAIWQLDGQAYGLATGKQKNTVRARHQDLFQSLTGEYVLLGLVGSVSPEEVMRKMITDVHPLSEQWLEEASLTQRELSETPAGKRAYFLIAPLTSLGPSELLRRVGQGAEAQARELAGFTPLPPSNREFETWWNRSVSVEQKIPSVFRAKRVGYDALWWITNHLAARGANSTGSADFGEAKDPGAWTNTAGCLSEPYLDEGDISSLETEGLTSTAKAHLALMKRRYVRVQGEVDDEPSYQQFCAMSLTPQGGFIFPGSEFVNIAAELPLDVDFCIKITSTPAERVKRRNRRAERNLSDQYKQRSGDGQTISGTNTELEKSTTALAEYIAALNANDREVEVAATVIFASSGQSAEIAEERMRMLRDLYASDEWGLTVPLGGQEALFWDFWPGVPPTKVAREFTQVTTGRVFSMGVPITSDALGTNEGFRIATNITTGRFSPVFLSLAMLAENDMSGSFGAVGELGSGKSAFGKTLTSHVIDRNGRVVIIDPSDNMEWAALAKSLTRANVLNFMAPEVSLDPLKVFGMTKQGVRYTHKLLTLLLGIDTIAPQGALLNRELHQLMENDHEVQSLGALRTHLASEAVEPDNRQMARQIASQMDIFADTDFGGAFFDDSLPPLELDAPATVFCTHGLVLPTREEMSGKAGTSLSVEQRVGRAAYALMADVSGEVAYEDDAEEVLFLVDEAHRMTGSPEGEAQIKNMIKTGRKHKAAVGLLSHAATELGSPELRGLIPLRFVFRARDRDLAAENLRWLDSAYEVEEYIDLVTKDLSPMDSSNKVPMDRRGEALFRDQLNRVGKIKVMIPRSENRAETVLTSPPKKQEAAA